MGQNLSYGVYLPDEGERNCYSGLATNWNILNTAVGNIAGKASFSHTHGNITNDGKVGTTANLPLITGTGGAVQAGSFGNAANTFCEGNDSRLSDARTPVAHTHTKSDVTDLLNSNFIPSANNSYDLGSSSYQWNNLYAKNYYYNGTAWGLDKANTWTEANSFYKSIQIHGGRNAYIMPEFGASYSGLAFGTVEFKQSFKFGDWVDNNSTIGINTSNAYVEIYAGLDSSDNINKVRLHPVNTTVAELGTSTNKWKSLNGINLGALSLPNSPGGSGTVNVNYYDLSSIVTIRDGSGVNSYQPVCDGWIAINSFATWIQIANDTTLVCVTGAIGADGFGQCYLPVRKNDNIRIVINQTNTNFQSFKLIPCQGNV